MVTPNKAVRELFNKAKVKPVHLEIRSGATWVRTSDGRTLRLPITPNLSPSTLAYVRKGNQIGANFGGAI